MATIAEQKQQARSVVDDYDAVRGRSEALAAPLSAEDAQVQTMADVSPTKWHLAHVTWFFETFLLKPHLAGYAPFDPRYGYLFNSYYEAVGPRHARARRGDLSRPCLAEVMAYRAHVDTAMRRLLTQRDNEGALAELVELGLHHEQQHQELILMDIKHVLSCSPLAPAYGEAAPLPVEADADAAAPRGAGATFAQYAGGLYEIGLPASRVARAGFAFDNETPRHTVHLGAFRLARDLVTNADYLAFVADGGYAEASHWLSDGWAWVKGEGIDAPLYWRGDATGGWREFTLAGEGPLDPAAPVCHLSYYEADAYARWAGCRLPTEAEWEVAASAQAARDPAGVAQALADDPLMRGALHPALPVSSASPYSGLRQLFGAAWQWTASAYLPYPGFRASAGAIGEYNGKFMINQMVLRGGAVLTPPGHSRLTYRNFFYPHQRWPMTGLRLAADA